MVLKTAQAPLVGYYTCASTFEVGPQTLHFIPSFTKNFNHSHATVYVIRKTRGSWKS